MRRRLSHRGWTALALALIAVGALAWPGAPAYAATFDQLDQQISGASFGGASVDPGFPNAQTFTPSITGPLPKVDIEFGQTSDSLIVAEIRRLGDGGKPTGALLASTSRRFSQTQPAWVFITFTFATPPTLTAGTEYAIVLSQPADPPTQRLNFRLYGDSAYGRGTSWNFDDYGWRAFGEDIGFRTYVQVTDTTAPTVVTRPAADSCSLAGADGWCRGTQTAGFTASDAGAGLAAANGCAAAAATCDFTKSTTTNGAAVTIASGAVADVGGNTNSGINSAPFKIDSQAPGVVTNAAANSCTVPGTNGWCRGTQTAGFTATDNASGLVAANGCAAGAATCTFTRTSMTEGAAISIESGAVGDVAGNSNAGTTAGPFKIDRTAPSFTGTPPNVSLDQTSPAGAMATFPTPAASDALSGMPSVTCAPPSGSIFPVGVTTVTCTATDLAGNTATTSFTVTVRRTFCGAERATIIIAAANLTTTGTGGRDVILGTSGRDIIRAGAGDDLVCGDGGDDDIQGEGGDDTVYGEGGADRLDGGYGDDALHGGDGDDILIGGFGHDTLNGGAGADTLDGDAGNDQLDGGTGNDTLRGGPGNDALVDSDTPNALMDGGPGTNTCTGAATTRLNCGP